MRMRHIISCGLSGSAVYFQQYLKKGTIFEEFWNIKCVLLIFSQKLLPKTILVLRRTEGYVIKNV
jgi:hypothetical protein